MLTKPLWPVVEYAMNYDYIVNELCENKDKPEMHCNGKCYLTKQLAEESAGKKENPFNDKTSKIEIPQVIISESLPEYNFSTNFENKDLEKIAYRPTLYHSLYVPSFLQPPQFG